VNFGGIRILARTAGRRHAPGLAVFALVSLLSGLRGAPAAHAADYFKGGILHIVVGTPPGGGYDAYARLVGRHLGDFVPGKPNIVVENMPGASGVKAANYLYSVAPRDGTVIASFNESMPMYQKLGKPGIQFKADEFAWIGSLSQAVNVLALWHTAGIGTIAQATEREIIMGADSGGGTMSDYPLLLNATLGTKFKVVAGYEGSSAVALAMARGEVQGDGANPWATWKATHPDWVRDRLLIPLVQVGLKKDVDLPDVPLLIDLATNDEQRLMFRFVSAPIAVERPYAGPPGMAPEARDILRAAFTRMSRDADFTADAEKSNMDLDPQNGEDVAKIVDEIIGTPDAIAEKMKLITAMSDAGSKPTSQAH